MILLGALLSSEIKMFLFSGYREGTYHIRVTWSGSGKNGKKGGRNDFSASAYFLKFLQLKVLKMPMYYILGWCVLNPISVFLLPNIDEQFPRLCKVTPSSYTQLAIPSYCYNSLYSLLYHQ